MHWLSKFLTVCSWVDGLFTELSYKALDNPGVNPRSGISWSHKRSGLIFPSQLLFFPLVFIFSTIKDSKHAFKRCDCRWKLLEGKRHMRTRRHSLFGKCEQCAGSVTAPNKPWRYTFGGENMIFRNVIIVSTERTENITEILLFLLFVTTNI